jgi:hypothetical protein
MDTEMFHPYVFEEDEPRPVPCPRDPQDLQNLDETAGYLKITKYKQIAEIPDAECNFWLIECGGPNGGGGSGNRAWTTVRQHTEIAMQAGWKTMGFKIVSSEAGVGNGDELLMRMERIVTLSQAKPMYFGAGTEDQMKRVDYFDGSFSRESSLAPRPLQHH